MIDDLKTKFPRLFEAKEDEEHEESEIILLGSGCSSSTPMIPCLLKHPVDCDVCLDALRPGSKNKRGNSSLLIRYKKKFNILVDCGKTFRESMVQLICDTGIRRIDAVLLTHDHADAILGLDDLREFTAERSVPVFLSEETFVVVKRVFPYLVDAKKATGSGKVAKLDFQIFSKEDPVEILGLRFQPICLDHGPNYFCLGFIFGKVAYFSDVVGVPKFSEELIRRTLGLDERGKLDLRLLFIDALQLDTCASHWSLRQTMQQLTVWKPDKTFLIGAAHDFEHDSTNQILKKMKEPRGKPEKIENSTENSMENSKENAVENSVNFSLKKKRTLESILDENVDNGESLDIEMGYDGLHYSIVLP